MTENSDFLPVRQAIDNHSKTDDSSSSGYVALDFSHVERANSIGMMKFVQTLNGVDTPLVYRRCPEWLVYQLAAMDALFHRLKFPRGVKVESIFAPFIAQDGAVVSCLLYVHKNIPVQTSYEDFNFAVLGPRFAGLIPDFDAEEYFAFIPHLEKVAAKF